MTKLKAGIKVTAVTTEKITLTVFAHIIPVDKDHIKSLEARGSCRLAKGSAEHLEEALIPPHKAILGQAQRHHLPLSMEPGG